MSEPESKNIESSDGGPVAKVSAGGSSKNAAAGSGSSAKSSGVAWLALLLVIVVAAGAAWLVREAQTREAAMVDRVAQLEATLQQKDNSQAELEERWQRQLNTGLGELKSSVGKDTSSVTRHLNSLEMQLAAQQKELARFSASDRESWLLGEAGHLLRLANQRLVMAGDPVAAMALLNSADSVLRELDDPNLHAVRAAVAVDVAALRAVPKVDVEGIYLRLAALAEQANELVIFEFPKQTTQPREDDTHDWKGRLKRGYESALSKLADYIIIRRRDVPMQALMDPAWEGLVRQNLRMLLEQSQIALLSSNQQLYEASLKQALQWMSQFEDSDPAAAQAISAQLKHLATLTIEVPQPNISSSQQALDKAIEQRAQTGGDE